MEQHRIVPFYQTYHMPPYAMPYMPPYAMNGNGYMPLYMAQEADMREDLQYLQEMFPEMSKRYAVKIASVVDRLDYKGSMIYDEYPDRTRLQRLARDIAQMIEKEEMQAAQSEMNARSEADMRQGGIPQSGMPQSGTGNEGMPNAKRNGTEIPDMRTAQQGGAGTGNHGNTRPATSDSRYREELIYVLLCYEIAKRRHGAGMDLAKFYGVGDV